MKTIIINEKIESKMLLYLMNEENSLSDKVILVKDYLDKHFARADSSTIGKDGKPTTEKVVAWLDDYKQLIKNLTDVQLFYVIQDEFKNIIANKEERDNFLKQIIKDWYNHKITKNGSLSV